MAKVKKSKKKIATISVAVVLVLAIISGSLAYVFRDKGVLVSLSTIGTGNIIETVSATADITSGSSKAFKASSVATVKEVFVSVGDKVKEGDVLATFDTSNLDSQISSLRESYNSARKSYNSSVKSQKDAEKKLNSINKQITILEKQVKKLEKQPIKVSYLSNSNSNYSTLSVNIIAVDETTTTPPTIGDDLTSIAESLKELTETLSQLTNNIETMNQLLTLISDTISREIAAGNLDPDKIAEKVGDAVSKAIKEGIIDETKLIIESGIAVDMIEAAVKNIDFDKIVNELTTSKSIQLTTSQIQLAALYAQKEIFKIQADSTLPKSQKKVMETAKSALDTIEMASSSLSAGWIATFDGTVTACDLVAGSSTTLLSEGIIVENSDTMVATISLGKYDILKVREGMDAKITSISGTYNGKVTFIAPTATGGSSGSILDSVGDMAGISGLSSLTASGAGVECQIVITNPDEKLIPGFDADVEISIGTYDDVTIVPIESIVLDKNGSYVYLYDKEEKTATKTAITTGAVSDSTYEVLSGVKKGDVIVATPSSDWEDTQDVYTK